MHELVIWLVSRGFYFEFFCFADVKLEEGAFIKKRPKKKDGVNR